MKLSKKLMMFEEFSEVSVDSDNSVSNTAQQEAQPRNSIRTEVSKDVDSILTNLEDLVSNLEKDKVTNESYELNENLAGNIMSAELYMIPIILAGGALTAVGAVGFGAYKLIDNAVKKKKIKKAYKKVHQTKLEAAKIEVALTKLGNDVTDAQKKKAASLKEKAKLMRENAEALDNKVSERFPGFEKFFAVLRSQSNLEVAEIMLKGDLNPTEQKRFETQLNNATESLTLKLDAKKEEVKKIEQKAASVPNSERIENLENEVDTLADKKDKSEDEDEIEQYDATIKMIDDQIEKLKEAE